MPTWEVGNEPRWDFFGVDPKKVPFFSAPKKPKKSARGVLSYTSGGLFSVHELRKGPT
jgi:hypothetical protein